MDLLYTTREKTYTILYIVRQEFLYLQSYYSQVSHVSRIQSLGLYLLPNYSYLYPDSNYLGLYLLYEYARGEGVLGFFLTWIAIYVLPSKKILDS